MMDELLHEKSLWLASFCCFAAMAMGFPIDEIKLPLSAGSFLTLVQKTLETQFLLFLLPVSAALPVGAVYVREVSSGFLKLYLSRINRMEYIRRKTFQIYFGGVLPFLIAGAAALLISFLFLYPLELRGEITWETARPFVASLLRVALTGGIMAELSGIFAALFQNYYMAYGLPFVSFYLLIILKERYFTEWYALYPAEWIKCQQDWGTDRIGIWIFFGVLSISLMLMHGLTLYARLKEV